MYPNHYYYYNPYYRGENQSALAKDMMKAINDEYSAIAFYRKLADMAHTDEARRQILEIRKNHVRHFDEFNRIYKNLTGRKPTPEVKEECPNTYRDGILAGFKNEQKTVNFYLDIADRTQDASIKEIFRRAAADEQNHAVWFLFFLQQH
ncbi:ferritin-like domain-containing protein [Bacillus shivajii]|uniref:ferritin-like domain-containing protein n=1 Tax=Bacillus shivajii TaxID=1983719 RepID=UPI001CFBF17A|nr:ferritin-like domain-containing protein [Bacillus shivajii]UCZ53433.1 ferritin-like domain-containing protein [Bacillus shivajii]